MDLGRNGTRTLVSPFPSLQKGGIRLEALLEHEEVSVRCGVVGWVERSLGNHHRRRRPGRHGLHVGQQRSQSGIFYPVVVVAVVVGVGRKGGRVVVAVCHDVWW